MSYHASLNTYNCSQVSIFVGIVPQSHESDDPSLATHTVGRRTAFLRLLERMMPARM